MENALEPEFTHLQVRNSDLKRCITFKTTNPRKLDEEQLNLGLSFRDELITRVQHGELTPSQAEAEAAAAGFGPLAQEPEPGAFDPMNKSRWTFVMALAWIAWRNIGRVRENCSDFCANRTIWRQQRWRGPVEQGRHFAEYDGWFLEALKGATVPGLEILESILRESGELPSKSVATVPDAEALLLSALSEGHIVAEAKDSLGKPVDIPERDWSYLKRFQENNEDVFKFESLDRTGIPGSEAQAR